MGCDIVLLLVNSNLLILLPLKILSWRFVYHICLLVSIVDLYIVSIRNLLALISVYCTRSCNLSMVLADSCTLCSSFATLVSCAVVLLGRKTLLELSLVTMKGHPCSLVLDVAPATLIVDGIVPFSSPILIYASFR